jgi:hypothetical protein
VPLQGEAGNVRHVDNDRRPVLHCKVSPMLDSINLDRMLSSPIKFGIMAQINREGGASIFRDVRRQQIKNDSAPALQHHTDKLEAEGYIVKRKTITGNQVKTELCLTDEGRRRFIKHCAALRAIAA